MRRVLFLGGVVCLAPVGFVITGAPQTQQATNPAAAVLKPHLMTPRAALDGTFETIDVPGAVSTACNGLNDGGRIVGRFTDSAGNTHGFIRVDTWFGRLDFPFANFTTANGISGVPNVFGGNVYGGLDDGDGSGCLVPGSGTCHAFVLTEFGYTKFVEPPRFTSCVKLGVSEGDGVDVGACTDVGGIVHGVRFSVPARLFDPPGATLTFATGANNNGTVVGRWDTEDGMTHGYRLVLNGEFEPIDVPDALSTVAHGISTDGTIVGEYFGADDSTQGFVLRDRAFESVDVPDATATVVKGINASGMMVGVYSDADGNEHGFLYTPSDTRSQTR